MCWVYYLKNRRYELEWASKRSSTTLVGQACFLVKTLAGENGNRFATSSRSWPATSLVIRAKCHEKVKEATQFSQCPIINGLTDVSHPCQALADILTAQELNGGLDGVKMAYLGDGNNVAYSLAIACSKLGVPLRIGAPKNYQFEQSFLDDLNSAAGSELIVQTADPREAADGATAVYTDVWTSMGQEAESKQRLADLADYQVNQELMNCAADGAKFLHCLPARRGEEVTTEVIDSPASAIIQQANNRLHAQKGLVVWLMTEAQKAG